MSSLDEILERWKIIAKPFDADGGVTDISSETVSESVEHFLAAGGDLGRLLGKLNRHLSSFGDGRVVVSEEQLTKRAVPFSNEFYFLMCMSMKHVLGDPAYHYDCDGDYSSQHKMFELGPVDDLVVIDKAEEPGRKGVSGKNFRTAMKIFRESVKKSFGNGFALGGVDPGVFQEMAAAETDKRAKTLIDLLNSFILKEERHVDLRLLDDPHHWYTIHFVSNFYEFIKILSGDPNILDEVGRHNISDVIKILASAVPVETGYRMMPWFSNKYNELIRTETVRVGKGFAVVRLYQEPALKIEAGRYFRQVLSNSCQLAMNTMESVAHRIYGLDTLSTIESACAIKSVPRPSIRDLPWRVALSQTVAREKQHLQEDYCEYIYRWKEDVTGWKRILTPRGMLAVSSIPVAYIWTHDIPLPVKILSTALGFVPAATTSMVRLIKQREDAIGRREALIADQDECIKSQIEEIERINADYHRVETELRTKLAERILANAASLLNDRRYPAAAEEFSNYLRHTVDKEGLVGYSIAFFRTEGSLLPDVHGANIKVIAPGERISGTAGIDRRFYVKKYPDFDSAKRAQRLSRLLHDVGAVNFELVFEDEDDHSGYVLVEELHVKGSPGLRAPTLLELHDSGSFEDAQVRSVLGKAADLFAYLWAHRFDEGAVEHSWRGDAESAASSDLEETVRKCVGVRGSDSPLTAGLYTFIEDEQVIRDMESCLRKNASTLLKRANSHRPMVSFDFSPRNLVYVADGDQRLVDLDRIDDLDMARFFARFTEMSDFIDDKQVVVDADVTVGEKTVYQKGASVSSKDLLFCDFLSRLYAEADSSLKAVIDSDASSWLGDFPIARFSKALRHFGSFSHWSRKYAGQGELDAARDAKRHALNCLDNVVSSLDDIISSGSIGDQEKASAKEIRRAFAELVMHLGVYGLSSDMHLHGSLSHCVAKHYGNTPSPATPVDESLALVRSRIEEKLDSLKGRLEHVCIVEHTRFVEYGVPFQRYKRMIDDVFASHRRDFARLSFGLEMDLVGSPEQLELDLSALDERAKEQFFMGKGVALEELSSAEEVLSSVDAFHVGLHYRAFKSSGRFTVKDAEGYARALKSAAESLARLKAGYGPSKFCLLVHPWKCAYDINKFNSEDGRPERIACPSAAQLEPFFRVMYDNGLPFELNAKELSFVGNGGCRASLPILSDAIRYYAGRNASENSSRRIFFCRTSDVHNDLGRLPVGLEDIYAMLPGLKSPFVVINR